MPTPLEEESNIPVDPLAQQMSVDDTETPAGPEAPGESTDAKWEPVGDEDALRWKRRKTDRSEPVDSARPDQGAFHVFLQQVENAIDPLMKKQLDREVPFDKIPKHQIAEYAAAEAK